SQNKRGRERITCANGIDDLYWTRRTIGPPYFTIIIILLIKETAVCATRQCDQSQAEHLRQPFDMILSRASEVKHGCQSWQFVIVQLEHICPLERLFDHITRIELLPKINVKNAQRVCWRRRDQLLNCIARRFASLGQTSEADCVRLVDGDKRLLCYSNMVPRHIFLDGEMGKPIAGEFDLRDPSRCGFVDLHTGFRQAHLLKAANDFAPVVILPHARDNVSLRAESVRMIGEVCWRSTQLRSGEKQ